MVHANHSISASRETKGVGDYPDALLLFYDRREDGAEGFHRQEV
jgi:hypothetical protein